MSGQINKSFIPAHWGLWSGLLAGLLCVGLAACGGDTVILGGDGGADASPDPEPGVPDDTGVPEADVPPDIDGPTRCRIPPAPDLSPLRVARAFPTLLFQQPIYLTSARDGTNRLFVVEKQGIIYVFPNDARVGQAQVFLDLRDRVFARGGNDERGLLGLAFDPDYANNGYLWVNYTSQGPGTPTTVSRFKVSDANPDLADPASEVIAFQISQPFGNHNGGQIEFGPDGMLYISVGDGGSAGDPENNGQNLQTFFGTILRIDVRTLTPNGDYRIPADNPYIGGGGLPEIWAWGLRNVWRFSFDRLTGQLWAADVGQRLLEEIDIIERGGNYGWRPKEGTNCYNPSEDCEVAEFIEPITQYAHTVGLSITGGYVYRGARLPELNGAYIYGDFANGQIFALLAADEEEPENPLGHDTAPGFKVTELALTNLKLSSFGEDEQGEVFIVDYAGGGLYQLERADGPVEPSEPLPLTLTETGCFDDVPNLIPERKLIPYTVNAKLWSDDSAKERFFVLPEDGKITYSDTEAWDLPVGAVVIKNFFLDTPEGRRIIETRFLVREAEKYSGYSYQWNDEQTEAFLLPGAATKTFRAQAGGQLTDLAWDYPSRSQCRACHTDASGQVLGLTTGQLNLTTDINGQPTNQIEHFKSLGILANPPGEAAGLPAYPDPFGDAPLADRARAYMHANCAHCHLPNGVATSDIDLRYETALADLKACGEDPKEGDLGTPGLKLIEPGVAQNSSMYRRMLLRNDESMPPLASAIVDEAGADLVRDWINSLNACQ